MIFDICIIGGGAAGLMAAAVAKQQNKNLNIVILERLDRVGKKLALTGNGRCNITNRTVSTENYYGKNREFIKEVLARFTLLDTEAFFEKIGTPIIYEGDKGYPSSLQAASVTDALRFFCDGAGVKTMCQTTVSDIRKKNDVFYLTTNEGEIKAYSVIAAGGMYSGGEKLGNDGTLYNILKKMGLKSVSPSPAIVQLKTDTDFVKQLKGIKVDAAVSVLRGKQRIKSDFGEVLFCDYGLSGPPILQVSGHTKKGDIISLDIFPAHSEKTLFNMLSRRRENLNARKNEEFLSGLINKRLGQVIIKRAGCSLGDSVSSLNDENLKNICRIIKAFDCTVLGDRGFINSQATLGGIETAEFYSDTLMCKKFSGLFAAGEILDVTGDCGGFNLQWAWSSAFVAATSAASFVERKK